MWGKKGGGEGFLLPLYFVQSDNERERKKEKEHCKELKSAELKEKKVKMFAVQDEREVFALSPPYEFISRKCYNTETPSYLAVPMVKLA